MQVDSFTVLLFGLFIKLLLGGLFAAFWFNNRSSPWFAWWGAALGSGSFTAALFMLRTSREDFITIGIGNSFFIVAFACLWQGARVFEKRRPLWAVVFAAPACWVAISLVPGFLESVHLRILVSSCIVVPLMVATTLEFWRGRHEPLASRWLVTVVCV